MHQLLIEAIALHTVSALMVSTEQHNVAWQGHLKSTQDEQSLHAPSASVHKVTIEDDDCLPEASHSLLDGGKPVVQKLEVYSMMIVSILLQDQLLCVPELLEFTRTKCSPEDKERT